MGRQDGIDYLVMEYLEGETQTDNSRAGPPSLIASGHGTRVSRVAEPKLWEQVQAGRRRE